MDPNPFRDRGLASNIRMDSTSTTMRTLRLGSLLATLTLATLGLGCGPVITGAEAWTPPSYYADEHYVELDGLRICYLESGPKHAPTIVFVHGWSGNVQNWWDQFEHFQHRYRVIVFDAPGHGKSERGEHVPYSMQLQVDVLDQLLDELEVEQAIVVGNSGGGWIAAKYAIEHPERVSKLVLSDTTGSRHTGKAGPVLDMLTARWLQIANMTTGEHYPGLDPKSQARQEFVSSFAGTVEEAPYLEALATLLAPTYARIGKAELGKISAPTLILWGDNDPVIPVRALRSFERAIDGSQSYVIRLGGHTPMMQAPEEFNCAVDKFLDGERLEDCKQYALTVDQQRDQLAARYWGPSYER
jgi:pimeloyl-ACP methyl ester carboxylesterase